MFWFACDVCFVSVADCEAALRSRVGLDPQINIVVLAVGGAAALADTILSSILVRPLCDRNDPKHHSTRPVAARSGSG